jgi:ABC-type branched-subunit amino acid transport system substrate-binding protein
MQTWLPQQLDRHRIGVLAFNVPQSTGCAQGLESSFAKYPTGKIVFMDKSLTFGSPDYSAQVAQMKDKQVDLVISCIDGNGATSLAREMKKQALDAVQILPNSYNQELISKNAELLDGNYLFTTFTPLEVTPEPAGMQRYKKWMKQSGGTVNENSLMGWINADEFVTGLKAAGPNFTRQKVIDATNAITNYTAEGLVPAINWTTAHEHQLECYAALKVEGGKFKPVFGEKGKPFRCFPYDAAKMPANPKVSS